MIDTRNVQALLLKGNELTSYALFFCHVCSVGFFCKKSL